MRKPGSRGWRWPRGPRTAVAAVAAVAAAAASTGAFGARSINPVQRPGRRLDQLANGCFSLRSGRLVVVLRRGGYGLARRGSTPFYLKPTGLGTFLVFDRGAGLLATSGRAHDPGPQTEWAIAPSRGSFTIRATGGGGYLGAGLRLGPTAAHFALTHARGCRVYPEAQVGAFGAPFSGTRHGKVNGWVDLHVHVTADMRAGGDVIYGEAFDRYGITQALSAAGDAAAHGQNGTLDVTGNLIRGTPGGTHDNHGWPTFKGWPAYNTITHQQVYYVWLKRSWMAGLRLIVAQTVDDHALCEIEARRYRTCDETQSIIDQIARLYAMQDYIDAQSGGRGRGWFRIVRSSGQARRVIEQGKLAVVIGIESSDLFGCSLYLGQPQCTQADIDRGLDLYHRLGVRTLFPEHWVNNAFGGAALEGGTEGQAIGALNVEQTGEPFVTQPCPSDGEVEQGAANGMPAQCNSMGLTDLGAYLIKAMMKRHMLIEADHMSELMRNAVIGIARAHDYPLISSHNGTGGAWSAAQLEALYGVGGFVAVTPDTAPNLAAKILALRADFGAGPGFAVGIGTDTGGLGGQPHPRADAAAHPLRYPFRSWDGRVIFVRERTGDFTYDLNRDGVAHYGLLADLLADIQQGHGDRRALAPLFASAEGYLETWERAERHS